MNRVTDNPLYRPGTPDLHALSLTVVRGHKAIGHKIAEYSAEHAASIEAQRVQLQADMDAAAQLAAGQGYRAAGAG